MDTSTPFANKLKPDLVLNTQFLNASTGKEQHIHGERVD